MTFKLFERRIAIKMTIDEGGIPTGSLSDYISGIFNDEVSQKTKSESQAALERNRQMELEAQRIATMRVRLLDPATSIGRLFDRFHAVELLEEVQKRYSGCTLEFRTNGLVVTNEYNSGVKVGRYMETSSYVAGTYDRSWRRTWNSWIF